MSKKPTEDLVARARQLDPDFHAKVVGPWDETERWREVMPPAVKKMWEKLDYSERLMAFVLTNDGGDDPDEEPTQWRFCVGDQIRFTTDVIATVSHIENNDPNPSLSVDDVPSGTEGEVLLVEKSQMMCGVRGLAGRDPRSTTIVYLRSDYCLERV